MNLQNPPDVLMGTVISTAYPNGDTLPYATAGAFAIATGSGWEMSSSVATAAAVQSVTIGSNHMTWSGAAPTTGTWVVGDICWSTVVTTTTTPGWMCTTAGTPGTWTAIPVL